MRKMLNLFACVSLAVLTVSCGILGMGVNNQAGATNGQASGMALKNLYSQYQADGKVDVSNLNNLINMAQLANSIQGLKNVDDKSTFYTDFASGLVLGSSNLVTDQISAPVTNTLQTLAKGTDLTKITSAGAAALAQSQQTSQQAVQQISEKGESKVADAKEIISDAKDEVESTLSSLNSIFEMFGK